MEEEEGAIPPVVQLQLPLGLLVSGQQSVVILSPSQQEILGLSESSNTTANQADMLTSITTSLQVNDFLNIDQPMEGMENETPSTSRISNENCTIVSNSEQEEISPPKKKRGRPRKNPLKPTPSKCVPVVNNAAPVNFGLSGNETSDVTPATRKSTRNVLKNRRLQDYTMDDAPLWLERSWVKPEESETSNTSFGKSDVDDNSVSKETSESKGIPEPKEKLLVVNTTKTDFDKKAKPELEEKIKSKSNDSYNSKEEMPEAGLEIKKKGRTPKSKSVHVASEKILKLTPKESADLVSCSKCKISMARKQYIHHQSVKHFGMSWIVDEEKPLDLTDLSDANQLFLASRIRNSMKEFPKKNNGNKPLFVCEKCKNGVASAVGFLSHITFCMVPESERLALMWECPTCLRKVLPVSKSAHLAAHKAKDERGKAMEEQAIENLNSLMNNTSGASLKLKTPKRKAAEKANSYLQETLANAEAEEDNFTEKCKSKNSDKTKGFCKKNSANRKVSGSTLFIWSKEIASDGFGKCRHVGCEFKSAEKKELEAHHLVDCPFKPIPIFKCLRCSVQCSTEVAIVEHVASAHSPPHEDSDDSSVQYSNSELSEEELCKNSPKTERIKIATHKAASKTPIVRSNFINSGYNLNCLKPYFPFKHKVPYRPVLKWVLDYCLKNFSEPFLFPELTKISPVVPLLQPALYQPNTEYSIPLCFANSVHPAVDTDFIQNHSWSSVAALTGLLENNKPVFFTGGPISSLAWCPTPVSENNEQLLAISCHRSMNNISNYSSLLSDETGLVQIWSFGTLKNSEKPTEVPKFVLGLGHHWGIVRHLLWCPSGCWAPEKGCYGLLAVACSDGTIRFLPVPAVKEPPQMNLAQCTSTLMSHSEPKRQSQCLKISWFSGKGHSIIAGGFADGLVCLWNLQNSSLLLRSSTNDVKYPYLRFQAHAGPVTAVELCPIAINNDEPRYLFTGGLADKLTFYWDLEKVGAISMTNTTNSSRKARVTDSTWLTQWPSVAASFEDVQAGPIVIPARGFSRHFLLMPQNSSTLSIDKSDWLNCIAQSTLAGEISISAFAQLVFGMDAEKNMKSKRALLTRTIIADLNPNSEDEVANDEIEKETVFDKYPENRFGLVFCDVGLDSDEPWCSESKSAWLPETMDTFTSDWYPLVAINRLAWNPNLGCFGWIAAGYQCGLVRLLHVKCRTSDEMVHSALAQTKTS